MEAEAQFSHWRRGSTEGTWGRLCNMAREKSWDVLINCQSQRMGKGEGRVVRK